MYKSLLYPVFMIIITIFMVGCEEFLNPAQDLVIPDDEFPADNVELRAASLGLYSLQQELVDQLVVLGELRGDLLEITENADINLTEIYNFQISPGNPYASPVNFYKLIAASNKMIRIIVNNYPEVTDPESAVSNYHYMLGEAICMRSWAYFNAARIFDVIPYIPETLTDISEINEFVNSSGTYVDSAYIEYHPNGFNNDTTIKVFEYTDRRFLDQDAIIRQCIKDIEKHVRVVGVDYSYDNNDLSWKVTVWNEYAMHTLLGQMYLHIGDFTKAMENFNVLLRYSNINENNIRFGLDNKFSNNAWQNILTSIDGYEHIYTLWFGKSNLSFQLNNLQYFFSAIMPNQYALKPTKKAVELWETIWLKSNISFNLDNPSAAYTIDPGIPGDFSRGPNVSYRYIKEGVAMNDSAVAYMLDLKLKDNQNELYEYMEGVDTVVYKYTIGKQPFDHDANFMVYRAGSVHLYASEIYANWVFELGGFPRQFLVKAEQYIYDGLYQSKTRQEGVSGRVGFADKRGITVENDIIYKFNPYTKEVIGYERISSTLEKQLYLEEIILDERARELAFEGERFYDLVRIARRRNKLGLDGSAFLADMISAKFPSSERESIRAYLMNPNNWYLPFELR